MTQQNINTILENLTTREITPENIITMTIDIMQHVQEFITQKGQGDKKKELVILVIKELINKVTDENIKTHLNTLVNTCVPETIDMVILVASGKLDLGKLANKYLSCCF